jgi:hypothetical protein
MGALGVGTATLSLTDLLRGGIAAGLIWLVLSTAVAYGNDAINFYARRTQLLAAQSFQIQQSALAAATRQFYSKGPPKIKYSGGTKAKAAAHEEALRDYLSGLVPAMAPSSNVAHIPDEYSVPVDATNAEKKWTGYYAKAKNSLRPHVQYTWNSNAARKKSAMITLTEEHVETLKDNFDILMWYRNQLDLRATGGNHLGDQKFKQFLDYFVADLLEGLPSAPQISLATGSVDAPEWELDERKLREQLIMAYRYLIAKYQIYPEYEEFGPADRELLISMMKIAFLMGAHMNPQWFHEMDVNLTVSNKKTQWKKPMGKALEVLQIKGNEDDMPEEEQLQSPMRYEEACVIAIPPPKPRQVPDPSPQPKQEQGQKIEIIIRPKS